MSTIDIIAEVNENRHICIIVPSYINPGKIKISISDDLSIINGVKYSDSDALAKVLDELRLIKNEEGLSVEDIKQYIDKLKDTW